MPIREFWADPFIRGLLIAGTTFLLLFLISFHRNRYRLRSGVLFLCFFAIFLFVFVFAGMQSGAGISTFILILLIFAGLMVISAVLLVLISLFYNGIILLRREGVSFQNLLSLILLLHLLGTPLIIANASRISNSLLLQFIVGVNGILTFYFILMALFYVTSGVLVVLTSQHLPADYIIVLGCGLKNRREVTPLLAGRVDSGIKLFRKSPERSYLVMSGGQGADEDIPEAAAMKQYARSKGVPEDHILTEEQSTTTEENMKFSKELIRSHAKGKKYRIAYATNRYHQFRAGAFAHDAGMNIRGVGSRTKTYFEQNAIIREFIAMLHRDQKIHMLFCSLLTLLYLYLLLSSVL